MMIRIIFIALLCTVFSFMEASAQEFNSADEFYDSREMQQARDKLFAHHGNQKNYLLIPERLEYQSNEGNSTFFSEVQGWIGTDKNRLWLKHESEFNNAQNRLEEFEIQALYSTPVSRLFDFQVGIRRDERPSPDRTFGVIGLQGLAPYWFEIDIASFVSDEGDVSFRTEFEQDFLITQRLILQPRLGLNFAVQDVKENSIGSGLNDIDLGLRLRYEIIREVAPYVGITWNQLTGTTKDLAVSSGEEASTVSFVTGIRLWF